MLIDILGIECPEVGRLLATRIGNFNELPGLKFGCPPALGRDNVASHNLKRKNLFAVEIDIDGHYRCPALGDIIGLTASPLSNERFNHSFSRVVAARPMDHVLKP